MKYASKMEVLQNKLKDKARQDLHFSSICAFACAPVATCKLANAWIVMGVYRYTTKFYN